MNECCIVDLVGVYISFYFCKLLLISVVVKRIGHR